MYCMCCKLRHATAARYVQTPEKQPNLELPALSPLGKSPLSVTPYPELFTNFKESSEELLYNLLEKQLSTVKSITREVRTMEDLEETNMSQQASQDQRLYRLILRRIYIQDYSAERVIAEDLRLIERVSYPESLQRMMIETIDNAARIYRTILKQKLQEIQIAARVTLPQQITLGDFYHYFQLIIEIFNQIIDYNKAIRTYSHQAQLLLRYLQQNGFLDMLDIQSLFLGHIDQQVLHRRCMHVVLQDRFLRSMCSLAKSILSTNTFAKYETQMAVESLKFLVQSCFDEQESTHQLMLSRSCSQWSGEEEEDEAFLQFLRQVKIGEQRAECDFSGRFLKSIERKLRKCK